MVLGFYSATWIYIYAREARAQISGTPLSMSNHSAQESLSGILGSISLASWLFVLVYHLPSIDYYTFLRSNVRFPS